jgi:hypothetical protein
MEALRELKVLNGTAVKSVAKSVASNAVDGTLLNGTLANKTGDLLEDAVDDLDIYGDDDAGVYNILSDEFRNKTDTIVDIIDDPIDTLTNIAKNVTNETINTLLDKLV